MPMPPNAITSPHLSDTLARKYILSKQDLHTMKPSGGPSDMTPLPDDFTPGEKDVVCSWARQNHRHSGNIRFRKLVDEHAPAYVKAETKYEKTKVIADLIDKVRKDSPDGGFVKRDFYSGRWYEIGIERARDKVGHAIRKAADKLTDQQLGQRPGKQSKGGQAAVAIKKLKSKNTTNLDSDESEEGHEESTKGPPARASLVEYQSIPATLTPGAAFMAPTAQYHGIGTSFDAQHQHVNFSFPRHHVHQDSFQFHHHGSLGGILHAPMSEGHGVLRAPSLHSSHRQLMGGRFSWANSALHVSDNNEAMVGGGLPPSANPYLAQPQRRITSAGGSMLPPHQHPDYASYHSGFVGSAVVDTHVFPQTAGMGNDPSLSAALPIPIAYADQHLPYRRSMGSGSMTDSTRDASLMSRSSVNRGGRSLLSDGSDNWDAHPFHTDHQRYGTSNAHPSGERSNTYDMGGGDPFYPHR